MDLKDMKIKFILRADGQFTIFFEGFPEEQYIPPEYFDGQPALWVNRKGKLIVSETGNDEGSHMAINQGAFCDSKNKECLMDLVKIAAPRLRDILEKPEFKKIGEEEAYQF